MAKPAKNTICLWYDGGAEEAARFYAETFPDSSVDAVHRAPGDFPSGKKGDVLTVEFTVLGVPCLGLNGGPAFKHSEAFSFQVATADQAETDRYWDAIVGNGGQESACGWCKDKWGLSWQITPSRPDESDHRPRPRRRQARVRCDDDDEEDRHRRDRGGAPRLRRNSVECPPGRQNVGPLPGTGRWTWERLTPSTSARRTPAWPPNWCRSTPRPIRRQGATSTPSTSPAIISGARNGKCPICRPTCGRT